MSVQIMSYESLFQVNSHSKDLQAYAKSSSGQELLRAQAVRLL